MVTDKCDRICKWTQFMTYAVHTSSLNRIPAEMWNDFLLSFYFDTAERKWRGGDSGELVGGTQLRVRESESELRDAERRKAEFNWQTGGLIRGTEAVSLFSAPVVDVPVLRTAGAGPHLVCKQDGSDSQVFTAFSPLLVRLWPYLRYFPGWTFVQLNKLWSK